jgi:deoxyribodipyrimidine photo-lyase
MPAELDPTRAHGMALLQRFVPAMGQRYAKSRNFDHGPGRHKAVSMLSPYVRRRLVLEQELVAEAVRAHGFDGAEKFIEEVFWRGYFKGWLERRPQVWGSYVQGLADDLAGLEQNRRLRKAVAAAEAGETGIACFDAWAQELITTGYVHNHARMWFASIWIFTLNLPWRIGADFFYRHLLDGDPASNTLGWRWVAGLHTRGKAYEAKAWNIAAFTANRFKPDEDELASQVQGLEDEEPEGLPPVMALRPVSTPAIGAPSVLLLSEEDCRLEDFNLDAYDIRASAMLTTSHLRSPRAVSENVSAFEAGALNDAAARIGVDAVVLRAGVPDDLALWAARAGAAQIITPYATQGPLHDWLSAAKPALAARGIVLAEMRRDWDALIWPHATAGFFKVKQQIPRILERVFA